MLKENVERNVVIYGLWERGSTIDEIAFETSIPRSTVGYYVRKFNKKARSGEPIVLPHNIKELDSNVLAQQAFAKKDTFDKLAEMVAAGDIESAYKYLMVIKLTKELHSTLFPTKEETQAGLNILTRIRRQSV